MNHLSIGHINVELTSRCNKACWCCGRRKRERTHPEKCSWGDMDLPLVHSIARQVPPGILVQLHNSGEPLLYPHLREAIQAFSHCITGLNTNAILLLDRACDLIGNIDTLTISVIQGDDQTLAENQLRDVRAFLELKGDRRPLMTFRLLGKVDPAPWKAMPQGIIATRILHAPEMSRDYERPVTVPETGICQDLLTSVAIDRHGKVSMCVRFDPEGLGIIGDLNRATLEEIVNGIEPHPWHDHPRRRYIQAHLDGRRNDVPLCSQCDFYGCATPYTGRKLHEQQRKITGGLPGDAPAGTERVVQRRKRGTSDHRPRWLPVGRT